MEITWLGTAGFKIRTGNHVILLDPYLTRNEKAFPEQSIRPCDFNEVHSIFISHGHFDHVFDISEIVADTGASFYCSADTGSLLAKRGVKKQLIVPVFSDSAEFDLKYMRAAGFFTSHVQFDIKLLARTMIKMNFRIFQALRLLSKYPCGQVLAWQFEAEGRHVLFWGSAGACEHELKVMAEKPVEILLVPLQGHSDICRIAFEYVKILKPEIVIPHHHDNFFPPVSELVDISEFTGMVQQKCGQTRVLSLKMNQAVCI